MRRIITATLAGCLAAALCLALLAWLHARQDALRWEKLREETRLVAVQFAGRLQGGLEAQRIAIAQMATFYESSEKVTQEEFRSFASSTMKASPLCLRIVHVEPDLRVLWVHPPRFDSLLVGFDATTHPEGHDAIRRAIETGEATISEPLNLVGGSGGFILSAPAFGDQGLKAVIVCAIRARDFFEAMSVPEMSRRFEGRVTDGKEVLYASSGFAGGAPSIPASHQVLRVGGRDWRVHVRQRPEMARARLHEGESIFWTLGLMLTLAVGGGAGAGAFRLAKQGEALERTREQLHGTREQLLQAEKLNALGELVAGVAHEINNPLSGILGFTQLVLREDLPAGVRRRLETVTAETERASKIVRNLLTFARKHPPEKQYLGLNGVIEKTVDLRSYQLRSNQIEFRTDLEPDLPMTMLDFHQIQQVLLNLINNAEQAMLESGTGSSILVSTRTDGNRLEVRIADDGPGIPEEIQRRIFEPFFTTKTEGKGTGLGLSLCFGIMQEHGGAIHVESEPGQGTEFVLRLPILQARDAPGVAKEKERPAPAVRGLHILAVDDEPALLSLLVEILTSLGHRVDTASDVPEAVRKVGSVEHDLIICDMKMPRGSGQDVYRAIRNGGTGSSRRIVFTSGDGNNPETVRFLRETGSTLLQKPYRIEEIESIISEHGPH